MKRLLILIIHLLLISCQVDSNTQPENKSEDNVLNTLGLEDYKSIIRYPVEINKEVDSLNMANLTLKESVYIFDTIKSGDIIKKQFMFQNTGNKSLYILDTKVSCGCTVVSYNKGAILPNETGTIDVAFDSSEKKGYQDRSIILITNSIPNEVVIRMQGYIKQ